MKLVLAEKPSVAQSIAKVLGAAKREDGYLEGNGYVVSWCVGHLVELTQPEAYDAKYSKWAYADLFASAFGFFDDLLTLDLQLGNVFGQDLPGYFRVNGAVAVGNNIPHSVDLPPWSAGMFCTERIGLFSS